MVFMRNDIMSHLSDNLAHKTPLFEWITLNNRRKDCERKWDFREISHNIEIEFYAYRMKKRIRFLD